MFLLMLVLDSWFTTILSITLLELILAPFLYGQFPTLINYGVSIFPDVRILVYRGVPFIAF